MILGYVRVSTPEQARPGAISPIEQERIVKGYAVAKGASQYDVQMFYDLGVSGAVPMCERPAGKQLLETAKPGDVIIAAKLDRMFRSARDALEIAEQCKRENIELILWDMGNESITRSSMAKCFFTMASAFAELERERIRERIQEGRKGKRANNGFVGGIPPYGWQVVGQGRDARLEPNAQEQKNIRTVKDLCRRFQSLSDVARWMKAHGLRDRAGHPFRIVQIQRLRKGKQPLAGVALLASQKANSQKSSPSSAPTAPVEM